MATAFVGGATGYTGKEVVRVLVERGVRAVAHVRPDSPRLAEIGAEFTKEVARVDATPWDDASLARTFAELRPDIVFALLGTTKAREKRAAKAGESESSYETVDYGLTSKLLRASRQVSAKFVYLSALGAGSPSGAYLAARFKVEAEVRESGIPFVIARPSFVTGPDRAESRPLERVAATAVDAVLNFASHVGGKGLQARFGSMTARELATALVDLAMDPEARQTIAEPPQLREVMARAQARRSA